MNCRWVGCGLYEPLQLVATKRRLCWLHSLFLSDCQRGEFVQAASLWWPPAKRLLLAVNIAALLQELDTTVAKQFCKNPRAVQGIAACLFCGQHQYIW